jgi:hypothetical protein
MKKKETTMETPDLPDMPSRHHANKLVRLIRKLRWIGMEEEAQRVQAELAQCGVEPADSVVAAPRETD